MRRDSAVVPTAKVLPKTVKQLKNSATGAFETGRFWNTTGKPNALAPAAQGGKRAEWRRETKETLLPHEKAPSGPMGSGWGRLVPTRMPVSGAQHMGTSRPHPFAHLAMAP